MTTRDLATEQDAHVVTAAARSLLQGLERFMNDGDWLKSERLTKHHIAAQERVVDVQLILDRLSLLLMRVKSGEIDAAWRAAEHEEEQLTQLQRRRSLADL